jgi:hypothetical protein
VASKQQNSAAVCCDTLLACANNSKLEKHKKTERHIEKAAKAANSMT